MKALPTNSSPPLLSLKGISFAYNTPKSEIPALDNIYLDIMPQSFTSIVGPSGCGKSTLLSIICGLLSPQKGEVVFNEDILHDNAISPRIGFMPQKDTLFEWRTIYKNVTLGLEINHLKDKEHLENVNNMLKEYGLYQFCNVHPSELSGGMRQRAALIRTLAIKPKILLLDEAFSALDYQTRLMVTEDIYKILKNEGITALMVTHDISEAIAMSDKIIVLTHRPAKIKAVHEIDFEIKNRTPLNCRQSPKFSKYFDMMWSELNEKETKEKNNKI